MVSKTNDGIRAESVSGNVIHIPNSIRWNWRYDTRLLEDHNKQGGPTANAHRNHRLPPFAPIFIPSQLIRNPPLEMALAAKPMHHHHQQQQQQHYGQCYGQQQRRQGAKNKNGEGVDVKRTANVYLNKLSDRDTEAMGVCELDSMARSLPTDAIPSFLSAISDTRPTDKTPLRRHCVRLLSLLSESHPPHSLTPLIPRMITAVRSRLRDTDTSVRSACVEAVRSIATAASSSSSSSSSSFNVIIRPLCESLLLEQDNNAQIGSALCVAAAVEGLGIGVSVDLQRLMPRLVKLARSNSFKAKPALLALFGTLIVTGVASTDQTLGILVPCLIDFLGSEDWATRKAAADTLMRSADIEDSHLLASFKSSCISSCEPRRFDKVKIVRDAMNQMLDAWKSLPDSFADEDDADGTVKVPISQSASLYKGTTTVRSVPRNRMSRSPPPEASPIRITRKNASSNTRRTTSSQLSHKNPSDWKIETAAPQTQPDEGLVGDNKKVGNENNARFNKQPKQQILFEDISEDKTAKHSNMKETAIEKDFSSCNMDTNENKDLTLIRNQLTQIENQQSRLVDLLQSFIGSSQNGIRSLESRVHGLEIALDEISKDVSISTRKLSHPSAGACCRLPGADFLSSKFWRRTEGRRLSISNATTSTGIRNSTDKESVDTFKWDKRQLGIQNGFIVNPLAEVDPQPRSCSDASSSRITKTSMYHAASTSSNGKKIPQLS